MPSGWQFAASDGGADLGVAINGHRFPPEKGRTDLLAAKPARRMLVVVMVVSRFSERRANPG
jgi:hypothetical protein